MNRKKYTFESDFVSTEQTTVEADSVEEAEMMVAGGDCEWIVLKAQGNELELVKEE